MIAEARGNLTVRRMLKQVGKYEIVEKIGVGGFGAVFKGRDPFIKRNVAIKTCQSEEEEIKKRFFREAEFAGNLHHRNITTIYDFGLTEDGVPYIVQEFLTGEDLDKKIKRHDSLPVSWRLRVLMDVCDGLGYAHSQHLIHRDIKPANIRVLEDGSVKIMDFGIAKSMVSQSTLTQTGITLGTASYLAPEQIKGEPLDARTDIFSLGVLAYELFSGQKPFSGDHISTVLYKILNEVPPPASQYDPAVPASLDAVLSKAMRKDRNERQSSCEELKADFETVLVEVRSSETSAAGAPPPARPAGVVDLGSNEPTVVTPTGGVSVSTPRPGTSAMPRIESLGDVPIPAARAPSGSAAGDVKLRHRPPLPEPSLSIPQESGGAFKAFLAAVLILASAGGVFWYLNFGPGSRPGPGSKGADANATPAATDPATAAVPTAVPTPEPPPTAAPTILEPGSATFRSSVVSRLTLNGVFRNANLLAPYPIKGLRPGRYEAVFEVPGYQTIEKSFEVKPGEDTEVSAVFPPPGILRVILPADVRGATVYLGDKVIASGTTEKKIPAGLYKLRVVAQGYEPFAREVVVPEEDRVDVKVVFTPRDGFPAQ